MSNDFNVTKAAEEIRQRREAEAVIAFLRLAETRIEKRPDALPFKQVLGVLVISWLRSQCEQHASGIDITK